MSTYSRIKELAAEIQFQTTVLDAKLSDLGLPSPTFEASMIDELPPVLHAVQKSILEAADELTLLVRGPVQNLMHLGIYSHNAWSSLHAIVRFNIAKALPLNETATFSDIAHSCGLDVGDTTRILRHAMTYRIFCEQSLGVVGHTASSRVLAQDPTLGAYLANSLDEIAPAAYKMVEAMERWPGSQEPNEAGWNLAHNESRPMFEAVGADQKRAGRFANSMAWFHARPGLSVRHLTEEDSMKWDGVKKLVDVGGGRGTVCSALVKRYPELQCVVQDLPQVVGSAQTLTNNLTFMAHDFFEEQPVKDADVYLLRWVLHDWSDLYAAKILRALIPAMKPGSRLIINEFCFSQPGEISLYEQRFPRATDLAMKQIQNAKERDRGDWESLLRLAHPRFRILDIKQPQGSEISIITVALE